MIEIQTISIIIMVFSIVVAIECRLSTNYNCMAKLAMHGWIVAALSQIVIIYLTN